MKKLLQAILLGISAMAFAQIRTQSKVANYSYGIYGTPAYEHFSFWGNGSSPEKITYSYRNRDTELPLKFLGKTQYQGKKAFKVQFPNRLILAVVPNPNNTLSVYGVNKKYRKNFSWEYEGPVDGRGTFCLSCVEESEAAAFLKKVYLK